MPDADIRPYRPGDEPGIQNVIRTVFEEYGFPWQPDGHNRDAFDIDEFYARRGGAFWVLESEGVIIGTVGIRQLEGKRCDLCRLYLLPSARGYGYGKSLYRLAATEAQELGYSEMEIWSDTRLDVSHAMYLRSGAVPLPDRFVDDPDYPEAYWEKGYLLDLSKGPEL
jgi:putative acetyltransferase